MVPPSNRLEKLKGDLKQGNRVKKQWRSREGGSDNWVNC